jgi:hypothetical protein
MKTRPMAPITRGHLLTLSPEKRSMKYKVSLITASMDVHAPFNILFTGKGTQALTTHGNQQDKCTPQLS